MSGAVRLDFHSIGSSYRACRQRRECPGCRRFIAYVARGGNILLPWWIYTFVTPWCPLGQGDCECTLLPGADCGVCSASTIHKWQRWRHYTSERGGDRGLVWKWAVVLLRLRFTIIDQASISKGYSFIIKTKIALHRSTRGRPSWPVSIHLC